MFLLGSLVLFAVLTVISNVLYRSSPRGWLLWGAMLLVGMLLLRGPISDLMDPSFVSSVGEIPVKQVVSAREFTVVGWLYKDRHIVLAGTRLPASSSEQERAETELVRLLGTKKRVIITFSQPVRRLPEPWPAVVTANGLNLNRSMVAGGFLLPDGQQLGDSPAPLATGENAPRTAPAHSQVAPSALPAPTSQSADETDAPVTIPDTAPPSSPETSSQPGVPPAAQSGAEPWPSEIQLPKAVRYALWVLAGFLGATSLGMVLNRRSGWPALLIIVGLAIRSIVLSHQAGVSIWPPIVCLVMIVSMGGGGASANREFLEKHPDARR